jgi:putative membrane protein
MLLVANLVVIIVLLLHVWFLVLEMFLWTTPTGLRTFGNSIDKATDSAVLAANQGLYNGFLAAGLLWGLLYPDATVALHIKTFFLLCIIVAGAYGAWSVSIRILLIQALPAVIALVLLWIA